MHCRFFASLTLALLLPVAASAQSIGGLGNTDIFSVAVTPQYPTPFSVASLSFLSSSIDLANATLAVSVGGKEIYRGTIQPVAVLLGKAGSVTSVKMSITYSGTTYTQSLVLQPQDVVLITEPISSAPPLYLGKSLVPLEGSARIVAVANMADASGKVIDPAALSYSWTVEGAQIANSSGIGKSSILVASPLQYRERIVSVIVQSQMGNLSGTASLSLAPVDPSVRLYENDPLLGIRFDHALRDSYSLSGAEASLYAAPFSMPLVNGLPFIQWFLNGTPAQTGSLLTLRPTGKGQGNASLSLTASGGSSILATTDLSLTFGAKPSTNFFGL
jgi:hypothetical protein